MFNYSDDLQLDSEAVSGIYSNVMKRDYSTSGYKGRSLGATSHRRLLRANKTGAFMKTKTQNNDLSGPTLLIGG